MKLRDRVLGFVLDWLPFGVVVLALTLATCVIVIGMVELFNLAWGS